MLRLLLNNPFLQDRKARIGLSMLACFFIAVLLGPVLVVDPLDDHGEVRGRDGAQGDELPHRQALRVRGAAPRADRDGNQSGVRGARPA